VSTKTENGKIRNKLKFEEIGPDFFIKRQKWFFYLVSFTYYVFFFILNFI